ncbi:Diaminopimelate epimerase [Waddlia chondrophila 2032/99]|uniref:Diaminopimelate epimerase n=1 Tax=Waddlia chondrophila 2032/99 TaxID=765953 RepID=F8LBY1_9BACT|nr:Diaminopimelate epimerase [Waddlia chondrophila 2032/99]
MQSSTPTKAFELRTSIPFSKYTGCGNDFILIDNRNQVYPSEESDLAEHLCDRQFGVGADGVILLERSDRADFVMRIFNPDGTEAEMCGNGIRCLGKFLQELGIEGTKFTIEVMGKKYPLSLHDDGSVSVSMQPAPEISWDIELSIGRKTFHVDFLDTGVPHATLSVEKLSAFDLDAIGPKIRYHEKFMPQGTNVDVYHIDESDPSLIYIRTYERGVERETMACGTGATACAIIAWTKEQIANPIRIQVASGDILEFKISGSLGRIDQIVMKGPAEFIFRGNFSI